MSASLPTPFYEADGITLYCADNREVLPLIERVDHVVTDPPYTQRTSEGARSGSVHGTGRYIDFDGVDGQEGDIARACLRVAQRWTLIWCAFEQLGLYQQAAGDAWVRSGVWRKRDGMPQYSGDRPGMCGEACAIMHAPGKKRWNGGGSHAFWDDGMERDRWGHPTQKPVSLMRKLILLFTDPGELVLDCFGGSGTTGVACRELGRRCILIEREEKYCQIIVERLRQPLLPGTVPTAAPEQQELLP